MYSPINLVLHPQYFIGKKIVLEAHLNLNTATAFIMSLEELWKSYVCKTVNSKVSVMIVLKMLSSLLL